MRRESLRRHGVLAQVEGTSGIQLFREASADKKKEVAIAGDKKVKKSGTGQNGEAEIVGPAGARTDVEGQLEGYKGRGKAVTRFKEENPMLGEKGD